jgi:hypothetical protein
MYSTLQKNTPENSRKDTGRNQESDRKAAGKAGVILSLITDLSRRLRDGVCAFAHSRYPLCRYRHIPTNDHHNLSSELCR